MSEDATRRARIRTIHADAETAAAVTAAIRPDNTEEIDTAVDGASVETTIARESTGGLHATVDDYVVNLHVAVQCTNDNDHDNKT